MSSTDPQASERNPYAPPKSDVAVVRLRRPASSKWAIGMIGLDVLSSLGVIAIALMTPGVQESLSEGHVGLFDVFQPSYLNLALLCISVLGLVVLLIGSRSRRTYGWGGAALLITSYENLRWLVDDWRGSEEVVPSQHGLWDTLFLLAAVTLIGYLIFCFFMGSPSRRYYRITSDANPADQ